MRKSKLPWLALFPICCCAHATTLSVTSAAWQGVEVQFATKLEPSADGASKLPGAVIPAVDRAHRVIADPAHRRYFGYDLVLEPLGASRGLRLKLESLSLAALRIDGVVVDSGWTRMAPAKYPAASEVHPGETVAFDLLVNPATGQKIVEYLTLKRTKSPDHEAARPPRDFTLADVELRLHSPRVIRDGTRLDATTRFSATLTGGAVWIYLAGHGRFVFSLRNAPGFAKNGVVSGHRIAFNSAGTEFQLECESRIAPGSGTYNIYLRHDAAWRPRGGDSSAAFLAGAAGKAEWLVRRR